MLVTTRDDGPAYWQVDILWVVLAEHGTTDGAFSMMEEWCPKGSGPPPHTHEQDEMFYVLDGEITFQIDRDTRTVGAGAFVRIPRGTVHGFRVDSETAHVLNMYEPAGFEQVLMGTAEKAPKREMPPPGRGMAASMEEAKPLFERWGMKPSDVPDLLRDGADDRMAQ